MKINLTLLLIAAIWGLGFIPQKFGLESMTAMGFNAYRFALGAVVLGLYIKFRARDRVPQIAGAPMLLAGMLLGAILAAAAGFQQISLAHTSVANVAFITGFYVVIVPVCLMIVGQKYGIKTWLAAFCALIGLGLLSGYQADADIFGDALAFVGAFFWALHIIAITYFAVRMDVITLAFWQFVFCALFCLLVNSAMGGHFWPTEMAGHLWALLNGVLVVGIAYTLQVSVLARADPFVASVIFSLEAVFGAMAAFWILGESMTTLGIMGAALMLVGGIWVQGSEGQPKKAP